ncbi:LacI family DNA-binding transcriptional regulator [Brachybacterium sp. ACRRE]|uniref:LacI family DNA-binding transcriptional regulator n=1 Tax=Brachybacterium sp. ACRRE TaxID=2918184 RepID=UPI001EF3606C|nr:LacI family DNA-binding transcriptional regulator [Brachybacterium sp. ACRRE]MCG7310448.1 LacI family transcriptional regulator [Brachybacterium sp. ACRRE]
MNVRRPTILDVASTAGVSTATVSRVINGAQNVDKELSRRVRSAVRATGYVPNAAGRSLRSGASAQVAVVTPDAENPYFTRVISEVERMARGQGYSVMVAHTEDDLEREREVFPQLVSRQIAGVILTVVDENLSDVTPLLAAGTPLVLVDRRVHGADVDLVVTDNLDAGRRGAQHLAEQGFRRPVVLTGPEGLTSTEDRVRGFLAEWSRIGAAGGDALGAAADDAPGSSRAGALEAPRVIRGDLHLDSGREATEAVLAEGWADVVYATNNRMSAGAFEAMRGLDRAGAAGAAGAAAPLSGAGVPGLLATDDDLWTRLVTPSVSVVQQPIRATGRTAARLLGQRMQEPGEDPSTILLRPRILERESTRRREG